jgi:O-antigen/teichoic acid export membrane protein
LKPAHYSAQRARKSLIHFLIGKGLSATIGIAVLLVSIRVMTASEFGYYVAAIAFLEIFYLASGFGLSTIAQRYVAELRIKSDCRTFKRFIRRILFRRLVYAVLGTTLLVACAALANQYGYEIPRVATLPAFYGLLVLGCITRYFDEIFPALLLQGHSQLLVVAAHLTRLAGLAALTSYGQEVRLNEILAIEVMASFVCAVAAFYLLNRYLSENTSTGDNTAHSTQETMRSVSLRFYFVQLFGQIYGPNTGKLIVAERLGLAATGAYGFTQSIIDMFRHYLPAYLLANWVRPLMIARYIERRDLIDVNAMANVILKLSLLCIVPTGAFFLASGDIFLNWLSAGKVTAGSGLLTAFSILLVLQATHVVVGLVTVTVEKAGASMVATIVACLALPLSIAGAALFGTVGVVTGMAIGEVIWVATATLLLARQGIHVRLDLRGAGLILLSAVPAFLAAKAAIAAFPELPVLWITLFAAFSAALTVLVLNAIVKPFLDIERSFITRLLPARYFVW